MSEVEAAPQKLASYALPRRDESVVAAMPQSMPAPAPASSAARSAMTALAPAPGSAHAPTGSSGRSPVAQSAMQSAMTAALREEDQTMIARSRFGDEMSVHEERTVIGQIPKEALEFERMFAQRTQPPPPDTPSAPAQPAAAVAALPDAGPLPSFASEDSERPAAPLPSFASEDSERPLSEDEAIAAQAALAASEPAAVGNQPTSDTRGLVTLAEATQPSVARSVSARRLRVTLITLLVLAVLVLLFVTQKPR